MKFQYHKATITNGVQFTDCRITFGVFYVTPSVIDIACDFCACEVNNSDYIIKAVAIFALNCIINKKQIQHNIYCFGTISVVYEGLTYGSFLYLYLIMNLQFNKIIEIIFSLICIPVILKITILF